MYDASLGRFCSRDPRRYRDDNSLYRYVRNRLTVAVDPMGKTGWAIVPPVGAGWEWPDEDIDVTTPPDELVPYILVAIMVCSPVDETIAVIWVCDKQVKVVGPVLKCKTVWKWVKNTDAPRPKTPEEEAFDRFFNDPIFGPNSPKAQPADPLPTLPEVPPVFKPPIKRPPPDRMPRFPDDSDRPKDYFQFYPRPRPGPPPPFSHFPITSVEVANLTQKRVHCESWRRHSSILL